MTKAEVALGWIRKEMASYYGFDTLRGREMDERFATVRAAICAAGPDAETRRKAWDALRTVREDGCWSLRADPARTDMRSDTLLDDLAAGLYPLPKED